MRNYRFDLKNNQQRVLTGATIAEIINQLQSGAHQELTIYVRKADQENFLGGYSFTQQEGNILWRKGNSWSDPRAERLLIKALISTFIIWDRL